MERKDWTPSCHRTPVQAVPSAWNSVHLASLSGQLFSPLALSLYTSLLWDTHPDLQIRWVTSIKPSLFHGISQFTMSSCKCSINVSFLLYTTDFVQTGTVPALIQAIARMPGMMPGTKEMPKKSLWLDAWSKEPEAKTRAGARAVHFPSPTEEQSHPAGPVQMPPGQGRAAEHARAVGSGDHKPMSQSHFFFMVAGLCHFPISAGWVLIDSLWYPAPEGRTALFTGAVHRGQAFSSCCI